MTVTMRGLLKKNTAYVWLEEHQREFEKVKKLLSSELIVSFFDPKKEISLLTDASRLYGLGYALVQYSDQSPKKINLIKCGSRSLSAAESRYATVELECLAILWAVQKCQYYLRGHPGFKVITDHKPLVGAFKKALPEIDNARLLRS